MDLPTSGLGIGGMPTKAQCDFLCLLTVRPPIRDTCHSQIQVWGCRIWKGAYTTTTGETVQNYGD